MTFLPRLTGAVLTLVYTRVLTLDEYGLYAIVGALQLALVIVADMGIPAALVRGYWDRYEDPAKANTYLASIMRGSSLLSLAALFVLGVFLFLGWEETQIGWRSVCIFIPLLLISAFFDRTTEILAAICRVLEHADYFAVGKLVEGVAIVVAGVCIVYFLHGGVVGTLLVLLIGRLSSMIAYQIILWRKFTLKGRQVNWHELRECLAFGLPLVPNRLASWLKQPALKPVLANIVSLSSVGLFSLASSVASLPLVLSSAVDLALTPLYFKRRTEIGDNFSQKIERFAKIYLAVLLPVWVCMILFCPLIVRIFATKHFMNATPVCAVLLCSAFARSQHPFLQRQIEFLKVTWLIPLVTAGGAAVTLLATVLLAKDYGILAVAWVIVASDVLTLLGLAIAVRRYERVSYPLVLSLSMTILLTCIALWMEMGAPPVIGFSSLVFKILLVLVSSLVCYAAWIRKEHAFIKRLLKG